MSDGLRERARAMKRELIEKAHEYIVSDREFLSLPETMAAFAEECIKEERKRIAELEKALDYCDKRCASLHHPKKYQHGDSPECPVEALVNKALRRSTE